MDIAATTNQPTASGASESTQQLFEDYEAFLQLLTAQLEHQDPLDPMDTTEYTNQLIQYASVEQEIATNDNLQELIDLTAANSNTSALQYVGNTAEVDSPHAMKAGGRASWNYHLSEPASEVSIQVRNEKGGLVYEEAGDRRGGANSFNWNGEMANGESAPDGVYSLDVVAVDGDGQPIDVSITSEGEITGVDTTGGDVVFLIGDLRVSESAIRSIERA